VAARSLSHEGFCLGDLVIHDIKTDRENDLVFVRSSCHYLHEKMTWWSWPLGCPLATPHKKTTR
jgi:hypothetical protein